MQIFPAIRYCLNLKFRMLLLKPGNQCLGQDFAFLGLCAVIMPECDRRLFFFRRIFRCVFLRCIL